MAQYYYRQANVRFGPGGLSPVVRTLLMANGIVFGLQLVTYYAFGEYRIPGNGFMVNWFGLVAGINPLQGVFQGQVWRLGTYMFLHSLSSPLHIIFNMFYLWMFGVEVERRMGSRSFAWMYFISGLGAGLLTCLFPPFWGIPTIGASGAVFGVMLAYGLLFPNRMILVFFMFPVKAIFVVLFMVAVEVIYMVTSPGGGVAHITHVSGVLFAYLYLRYESEILKAVPRKQVLRDAKEKLESISEAEEQKRIDAILDKINREGMHKLSRTERAFLRRRAARRKQD